MVRDIRRVRGKFTSIVDLKVKLMEEFENHVPPTTRFSVGYFEGRQSTKKWLVTQEDLTATYSIMRQSGKTKVFCGAMDALKIVTVKGNANEMAALVLRQTRPRRRKTLMT